MRGSGTRQGGGSLVDSKVSSVITSWRKYPFQEPSLEGMQWVPASSCLRGPLTWDARGRSWGGCCRLFSHRLRCKAEARWTCRSLLPFIPAPRFSRLEVPPETVLRKGCSWLGAPCVGFWEPKRSVQWGSRPLPLPSHPCPFP